MAGNAVRVSPEVGYELWASTWDRQPSPIVSLEQRTLRPLLSSLSGKRFVDASCGTGRWLRYALEQEALALGFDLSPAMIAEAAREPSLAGRVGVADTRHLPVPDCGADVVLSALSLGHIPPAVVAFAELARLVAPGGRLFVTDFHPDASRVGWKRTFRDNDTVYEVENYSYSIAALREQAGLLGLEMTHLAEPCFGQAERVVFERAGKTNFDDVKDQPAVWVGVWRRPVKR